MEQWSSGSYRKPRTYAQDGLERPYYGLPILVEENLSLASKVPSAKVLERISANVGYWRRTRRQAFATAVFVGFLAVLGVLNYRALTHLRVVTGEVAEQKAAADRARSEMKAAVEETDK